MNKREILAGTDFGDRIAEEEAKHLADYFVETNQWKRMLSGEVDIAYGAKGSGKSAIFSLLLGYREQLAARGIYTVPAENPRGTPVFGELVTAPPAKEEEFRGLWKLYFLCLVGNFLRSLPDHSNPALQVVRKLEECRLLPPDGSLSGILRSVLQYVRNAVKADSIGVGVELNPATGVPSGVIGKITLREPGFDLREAGVTSVDDLLKQADSALQSEGRKVWVLLDRLDVAFAESADLESNALRALFRVYLDLVGLQAISIKIFLRTDIWSRIRYQGSQGFREASHIVRTTTIDWTNQSLLNLVVRRLVHNEVIRNEYKVDQSILADTAQQAKLFSRVFPPQANLDWMLSRLRDGSRRAAPRELIHLLHYAREIQLNKLVLGGAEPEGEGLFRFESLRQALPEVSKVRFEQTLCAEYPQWHTHLARLRGESVEQSLISLAELWQETVEAATKIAENLVEIGFFEKKGSRKNPSFWVPYVYQPALEMKDPTR